MKKVMENMRALFRAKNKKLYLKRKSRIVIGRAFQKLDKSRFLGENVPYAILMYFSDKGV